MSAREIEDPAMGGPVGSPIGVHGRLAGSWSVRLEGMSISPDGGSQAGPLTALVGRLPDQAALTGVLNSLYDLHDPVVSVECLEVG